MEKLLFDDGVKEFRMNGGVLRFNPADPNVYGRFLEAAQQLRGLEAELTEKAQKGDKSVLQLLQEADKAMKQSLNGVFGGENDFHKLLRGVNLLAVAGNGQRVVTNLLQALEPVLVEGAKICAGQAAEAAVKKAESRRKGQ